MSSFILTIMYFALSYNSQVHYVWQFSKATMTTGLEFFCKKQENSSSLESLRQNQIPGEKEQYTAN